MEDHIPKGPDRSLLLGKHTSKWSLWDVVFHENNSNYSSTTGCLRKTEETSPKGNFFGTPGILN